MGNENNQGFYAESQLQQEPVPKKGKKKKWPVVVGVTGAVAVAGGAAASYWFFFRTPTFATPVEAITSCMSQLDEQFSLEKLNVSALDNKLDAQAMSEAMLEKGSDMSVSVTFKDSDYKNLSMLNGLTFGYSQQDDFQNNRSLSKLSASMMMYGGDIQIYNDNDTMALLSDEFLKDAYISVDKKELMDLVEKETGESCEEYELMMNQQTAQIAADCKDFMEYLEKQLPDSLVSFSEDWDITDKGKTSLKIGDRDYDSYSYDITISAKAFHDFVEKYCDYIAEYDFENNSLFSMYDIPTITGGKSLEENIKEGLSEIPDKIDESSDETLDMTMYVAPEGQLLGIEMDVENEKNSVSLQLLFGGDNPGQDVYMTVDETIDGKKAAMEMSSYTTTKGDVETTTFDMKYDLPNDISLDINAVDNYNDDDDSFDASFAGNVKYDGETYGLNITMDGSYEDIEKGESYTMVIDSMKIDIDSNDQLPFSTMEFAGEVSCGVLKNEISQPEGTEYDLLKVLDGDEETIDGIVESIKKSDIVSMIEKMLDVEIDDYIEDAISKIEEL